MHYLYSNSDEKEIWDIMKWRIQWVTPMMCRTLPPSTDSELTESTYFQPLSQALCISGWPLTHSRKRWSKLADSKPCRHWFSPQNGSLLPPSAESPVALATESQSPTTQDTIRLIVRGSLGSCSSSSECKFARLVLKETGINFTECSALAFNWNISVCIIERLDTHS